MSVTKSVVVKDKVVERCWIDKRYSCRLGFTDRSQCVGNCEVYGNWASWLKLQVNRLKEDRHPYFETRLSDAISSYEVDDEVKTRWEERARKGVYDRRCLE